MKPIHERFSRDQVLHALETAHQNCHEDCPHTTALNDPQVLGAIAQRLQEASRTTISRGMNTEMMAFSEGLHFAFRLFDLEEPEPESPVEFLDRMVRNAGTVNSTEQATKIPEAKVGGETVERSDPEETLTA